MIHTRRMSKTEPQPLEIAASFAAIIGSTIAWVSAEFALAAALYVAANSIVLLSDAWRQKQVSYRTVLLFPFLLYAATPILHIGWGGNTFDLSEKVFLPFLVGSWLTVITLYWGLPTQNYVSNNLLTSNTNEVNDDPVGSLAGIACMMFGLYLYTSLGTDVLSRAERLSGQSFFQTFSELGFVSATMALFAISVDSKGYGRKVSVALAALYTGVEILYFGDRRTALSLLLALIVAAQCAGKLKLKIWHLTVAAGMLPLILVFGVLRSFPAADWWDLVISGTVFQEFSLMRTELGSAATVANNVGLTHGTFSFQPSYHLIILQVVPSRILTRASWLWTPSQLYAYEYRFDVFAEGGAFGYNILLESFQNLWIFGPIFLALVLRKTFFVFLRATRLRLFLIEAFTYATVFIYRADLASWAQTLVYVSLLGIGFWSLARFSNQTYKFSEK